MSSTYKIIFSIFKIVCITKVVCFPSGNNNETHSFYDQRQTGKYNIHISLRDVAIIEVDSNEFSDDTINNADEYYYDDEDLTIRPISNLISTTIKTPQIIVNSSLKSEIVNLQPLQITRSQQVENYSPSPRIQLKNFPLLESSLNSSSNSSLFPSLKRTTLEYDMAAGASLAKEPVSHVRREPHLVYVPSHKSHKVAKEEHSRSDELQKDHKINKIIPTLSIPAICRDYQLRDVYGNCRTLKRRTFLKGLFDVLKLV